MTALIVATGMTPAAAQQAVRLKLSGGKPAFVTAQVFRPRTAGALPAVAIFHGCGGIGVNVTRMAQRLAGQGIVALLVDSFGTRGIRDACTRNWPTPAQAADRTRDVDAAATWLAAQTFVAADRIAVMGYSYGGGVVLMRALQPDRPLAVRAVIAVYPDCALPDASIALPAVHQPTLMALAERDDWTPVHQCEALLKRIPRDRDRIETRLYAGAYHSFDAVGLPVTWLADAGNRSKPGNCCGAHYGYDAPAYKAFLRDLDAFLARSLRGTRP